ncbi:hypothetical protein OO009_04600 [Flavobacteriaceae bacterium KMM 6897]|nr:hypothetical protein [Flavobacteriaceae bacterium KMM 6897]
MWIYLLKFSALLAIFLVFYKIFLEQATMHQFKRFYLLGAFLIALCIPAITFTEYVLVEPQSLRTEIVQASTFQGNSIPLEAPINYAPWILWGIYGLGVTLFSFKFLINLTGVIKRIRNNPKERSGSFQHVLLQDPIAPHTFFSYVFFNKKKYESQQIPEEVFWHEETHAKQKHSLDVLLLELLQIVLWFHPLIYIAKHFIKLNHEFLADEAVLNKGVTTSTYQKIVLAFSSPDGYRNVTEPSLSNSINYSSIKKRIIIMKTHTSKKALWLKSLLLLPLLALMLYSFSDKKIVELEQNMKSTEATTQSQVTVQSPTIYGQDIEILINQNGQLLVNSFFVKMEDLSSFLSKYNQELSKEQRSQTVRSIITIDEDTPKEVIQQVEAILTDYGVATINLVGNDDSPVQEKGATKAEIKEYNALARKYNSKAKGKYEIEMRDMSRLKQLYDRMTLEQKASAEPFPNIPPPPAPMASTPSPVAPVSPVSPVTHVDAAHRAPTSSKVYSYAKELAQKDAQFYYEDKKITSIKGLEIIKSQSNIIVETLPWTNKKPEVKIYSKSGIRKDGLHVHPDTPKVLKNSDLPPPPPIPAHAPEAERIEYKKAVENYKKGNPGLVYDHMTEDGELVEIIVIDDENNVAPPMPPSPPSKHLAELAKEGAKFYLNGDPISSDEAIKITEKNKDINIDITGGDSGQHIVKLTTRSKGN